MSQSDMYNSISYALFFMLFHLACFPFVCVCLPLLRKIAKALGQKFVMQTRMLLSFLRAICFWKFYSPDTRRNGALTSTQNDASSIVEPD